MRRTPNLQKRKVTNPHWESWPMVYLFLYARSRLRPKMRHFGALMQIQLASTAGKQSRNYQVQEDGPVEVIEGKSGVAVKVGDRLVGFSGEDVSSVSLEFKEGSLHIRLHSDQGAHLGEYHIPGADNLRKQMDSLTNSQLYFSAQEQDELVNLMRLSMSGSISKTDILMLLDEISHIAAAVNQPAAIDAGDLYPDLARQVQELLKVMPDDIQRLVLLSNREAFPADLWNTFHFLSKVDAATDHFTVKFLAGSIPLSPKVVAEWSQIALRNGLNQPTPFPTLSPEALQLLNTQLSGKFVSGNSHFFDFAPALAKTIFQNHHLTIPNFAGASSFEALEQDFFIQTQAAAGRNKDPLAANLAQFLDTNKYRELADFLTGKPGAPFSLAVREGLSHFLRNMPHQMPQHKLSSLDPNAFVRLKTHMERSPQAHLLKHAAKHPTPPVSSDLQLKVADKFSNLSAADRLALFTLDRLDPNHHSSLFKYFQEPHGLSKMTGVLEKQLHDFLKQQSFPDVHDGLTHFDKERFQELSQFMKGFPKLAVPRGFLPGNPDLTQALLSGLKPDPPPAIHGAPKPNRGNALMRLGKDAMELAKLIENSISALPPDEQNTRLTGLLRSHLKHFPKVALLDQVWKAEQHISDIVGGRGDVHRASHRLATALADMTDILSGDPEAEIDWDLWKQEKHNRLNKEDPRPSLRDKLMTEKKGLHRYFLMDKWLPNKGEGLTEKVENLSWMQRLEKMLQQVETSRGGNHLELLKTLERLKPLMRDLADFAREGDPSEWRVHGKSPLTKKKLRQFETFRQDLLKGDKPDPDGLFKGPFLRSEFGEQAESMQRLEMKRFEPLFKEALARFASEPDELITQMMEILKPQTDTADATSRVRSLMESMRDFNQHQNLNQEPMYLSLPLKYNEQHCEMELAYFRLPGEKKDKKRFLVVIHLDFESWGHLRIDALKDADQLAATFWVENTKMHQVVLKQLHKLEDRLEEAGMGEASVNVRIAPQRATQSVAELCIAPHDGQVDLTL